MKVLITGSRGFVGGSLKKRLIKDQFIVYEFNRHDSLETLEKHIKNSDIIYHFAGEVKPSCSDKDFFTSNKGLTEEIVKIIKKLKKDIPIIFSSSIHAKFQKNSYGKSKKEAEILLEKYAKKSGNSVIIYHLPHLFGKGCKPNHNSVITTWMHNCIKEKEMVIYDENINISYTYINDLIKDFMHDLKTNKNGIFFKQPSIIYQTTLGEVAKWICQCKEYIKKNKNPKNMQEFKKKIFETMKYYYMENI